MCLLCFTAPAGALFVLFILFQSFAFHLSSFQATTMRSNSSTASVLTIATAVVYVLLTLNRCFLSIYGPTSSTHTQFPCRFVLLERYKLCCHKTTTDRDSTKVHCNAAGRVDNAMACHRTGYDRYDIQMLRGKPDVLTREKRKRQRNE